MTAVDIAAAAQAYAAYFAELTPESLERLHEIAAPDMHFVDPFNDVVGLERVRDVFRHMFRTTTAPKFTVLDVAVGGQGAYLLWRFNFVPKGSSTPWQIDGMSAVRFGADGRAVEHIDYWDAGSQFYARLPLLGALIRWISRRMAA
jgi:steroid Delta-isomerase